jgi:hypothetical protein
VLVSVLFQQGETEKRLLFQANDKLCFSCFTCFPSPDKKKAADRQPDKIYMLKVN